MLKKTLALLLSVIMSLGMVNVAFAENDLLKSWSFDDGDVSDFKNGLKVTLTAEDGILNVAVNNRKNAYFNIGTNDKPLGLGGEEVKTLKMRMKIEGEKTIEAAPLVIGYEAVEVSGSKTAEWALDDEDREIVYGGDFADYVFDLTKLEGLSEDITLKLITIQPARCAMTATVKIDSIEILGTKTIIPPSVTLSDKTAYPWYEVGDKAEFEAAVENAEEIKNVELFVNGASAGKATVAPYLFSYEFKEIGKYTLKAVATLGDDSLVESAELVTNCLEKQEKVFKEWTFDDNQKPADINCGSSSSLNIEDGKLLFSIGGKNANLNLSPYTALDFLPSEYPYLKITVKNTAKSTITSNPPTALWLMYAAPPSNGAGEMLVQEIETDVSGSEIVYDDGFYRQYIYDLRKSEGIDVNKPVKWIQTQFFRLAQSGTVYIDKISISDTASYDAVEAGAVLMGVKGGDEYPLGKTVTLKGDTNAKNVKSVSYYINGEKAGDGKAPGYTFDYTFDKIGTFKIKSVITLSDNQEIETDECTVSIIATNSAQSYKWDFDSVEGWYTDAKIGSVSASDGVLTVTINAESVPLRVDNLSIDGTKSPYLKIRIKNETDDNSLTFQWAINGKFSTDCRIQATADMTGKTISKNDKEFKEYVFDLSTMDTWMRSGITSVQFFPVAKAKSGKVIFDSIELFKIMPEVSVKVEGDMIYPSPVTITPTVKTEGLPIVKTEIYVNNKKVSEKNGVYNAPFVYTPAEGGEMEAFVAVHDSAGEVTFSDVVKFNYGVPYEFGAWECTTDNNTLKVKVPVKKNMDGFKDPVIFAAVYDKDGRMIKAEKADFAVSETMQNAEISYTLPENAAKVIVYAWDDLSGGNSYHTPLEVKAVK